MDDQLLALAAGVGICCAGSIWVLQAKFRAGQARRRRIKAAFSQRLAEMHALREELKRDNRDEIDETGPVIEGETSAPGP